MASLVAQKLVGVLLRVERENYYHELLSTIRNEKQFLFTVLFILLI